MSRLEVHSLRKWRRHRLHRLWQRRRQHQVQEGAPGPGHQQPPRLPLQLLQHRLPPRALPVEMAAMLRAPVPVPKPPRRNRHKRRLLRPVAQRPRPVATAKLRQTPKPVATASPQVTANPTEPRVSPTRAEPRRLQGRQPAPAVPRRPPAPPVARRSQPFRPSRPPPPSARLIATRRSRLSTACCLSAVHPA